jgi:hypothetical protein
VRVPPRPLPPPYPRTRLPGAHPRRATRRAGGDRGDCGDARQSAVHDEQGRLRSRPIASGLKVPRRAGHHRGWRVDDGCIDALRGRADDAKCKRFVFLPRGRPGNGLGCVWVKKRSSIGLMPDLDRSANLFEFSGSWVLYETFRTSSWQRLCATEPPIRSSSIIADLADGTYQPSQDQPLASSSSHK